MATVQRHKAWLADMESRGWKCGSTYDEGQKTHPCVKPWFDLSPEQQSHFSANGSHPMAEGVAPSKDSGGVSSEPSEGGSNG